MIQDGTWTLFQYWDRLRQGRPAPKRTDIEPADIKKLLGDTFILERDTRGEAVFRLAGTRLCAVYGRELKGFGFSSLWREPDRHLVTRLTSSVFLTKSVVAFEFEGINENGQAAGFDAILLPLDGGLEHPRCLGSVTPKAKPEWIGVRPVTSTTLGTIRVVDPDRDPLFLKNRPPVPVPQPPPRLERTRKDDIPIRPVPRGKRIRHLLVLDGGKQN